MGIGFKYTADLFLLAGAEYLTGIPECIGDGTTIRGGQSCYAGF